MGTLTNDLAGAISELRQGRVEFKMDRTGIIHAPIGKVGFDPQALLLKPSQDVLLFYLDAESNVLAWRLVYWPDTSPPYSIEEAAPYDLGVTALSLGQPWLTEGGQVGLPYTDLDGNVQTIYGYASGTTWAP